MTNREDDKPRAVDDSGRLRYQLNKGGTNKFTSGGSGAVKRNIEVVEDYREEHPIREREFQSLEEGASGSTLGMIVRMF